MMTLLHSYSSLPYQQLLQHVQEASLPQGATLSDKYHGHCTDLIALCTTLCGHYIMARTKVVLGLVYSAVVKGIY